MTRHFDSISHGLTVMQTKTFLDIFKECAVEAQKQDKDIPDRHSYFISLLLNSLRDYGPFSSDEVEELYRILWE